MTDQPETRKLSLRDWEFEFKPTMSAKDFGTAASAQEMKGNLFENVASVVRNTLIPSERKRWDDLWEMDLDVPITFEELDAFIAKLIASESSRPTQPPSPSGSTAKNTEPSSTGNSASPAVPATPPSPSLPVST